MAEKQRKAGEPRYPVGIRLRDVRKGKNIGERGANRGKTPSYVVTCVEKGCPSAYKDIKCGPKGLRQCRSCGYHFPRSGWITQ